IASPAAPTLLTRFAGTSQLSAVATYGSKQEVAPPDENLAVGAIDVVEATNSALYIFTRTGSLVGSKDIDAIVGTPSGWFVTDPRVLYDPSSGRFYLSVLLADLNGVCSNQVELFRSDSGDATGIWRGVVLRNSKVLPGATPFADQPRLGFSSNV